MWRESASVWPIIDPSKLARSALFDGGLVDLQLRALDDPSKLACTLPPEGGPIGFKCARPIDDPTELARCLSLEWHPLQLRPSTIPYLDNPSKLACDHPGMEPDWSPTARFDEHRHPENSIGLVCALGEQRRPTGLHAPTFPRAHSGSTGAMRVSFPPFPCAALGEHKKPSGYLPPFARSASKETTRLPVSTLPSSLVHFYLAEGAAATVMP